VTVEKSRSRKELVGRKPDKLLGLAVAPTLGGADALAQNYPIRTIRLVGAVAPGGNLDLVGRAVAQSMTEGLGRQVIVENRPGANSTIGADNVARASPDGYSLLMVAQSLLVASRLMPNPPVEPTRDFAGVSQVATLAQMLVVHPSVPVRGVKEFIAFAKARPGELNYATSGNGSGSHLAMELFMRQARVKLTRIPYNGDGPALVNLVGGQVPVKFDNLSTSLPHVHAGRLRPLGVTSPRRTELVPDVPAIAETLAGFEASIFNGMVLPVNTPKDILARLHGEIVRFVQSPTQRSRFAKLGVELVASPSPDHFSAFLRNESARYGKLIDEIGLAAQ
jgi:tripartite-type tricarboxylate transporter receptor subunit TctC